MAKRKLFDRERSPADRPGLHDPIRGRARPKLDPFAYGPLSEIVDRFRDRLLEEAGRIAGARNVDANHLERAYERLFPSSIPTDWAVFNRRRVYLIQKELAEGISTVEAAELETLQVEADRRMREIAPRPLEALWDLQRDMSDR